LFKGAAGAGFDAGCAGSDVFGGELAFDLAFSAYD
jgi:hypothetical protein